MMKASWMAPNLWFNCPAIAPGARFRRGALLERIEDGEYDAGIELLVKP